MGQTVQEFDLDVKVGDTVRIIDGAFTDYTGKITEIDNNKVKWSFLCSVTIRLQK